MLLRIILAVIYLLAVAAWSISVCMAISMWIKLRKLRRMKNELKRKDDKK